MKINWKNTSNAEKEETLECERCRKVFKNAKKLYFHLSTFLGILCCKMCDEKFKNLKVLKEHEKKKHQVLVDNEANDKFTNL